MYSMAPLPPFCLKPSPNPSPKPSPTPSPKPSTILSIVLQTLQVDHAAGPHGGRHDGHHLSICCLAFADLHKATRLEGVTDFTAQTEN